MVTGFNHNWSTTMTLNEIGQQLADLHRDVLRANPPEIMTPKEAAGFIGVTEDTLFRWRKDATGPKYAKPTERMVRYLKDDLIAFLKEHRG